VNIGVCVFVLPGFFREMESFYFKVKNKRDILNTTLLTKLTVFKRSLTMGVLNVNIISLGEDRLASLLVLSLGKALNEIASHTFMWLDW